MKFTPLLMVALLGLLVSQTLAVSTAQCTSAQRSTYETLMEKLSTTTNVKTMLRYAGVYRATRECCNAYMETSAAFFSKERGVCQDYPYGKTAPYSSFVECCAKRGLGFLGGIMP